MICGKEFTPDPRVGHRQCVCSRKKCQKERKRKEWRRWAMRNREVRRLKLRQWAQAYPHYWRARRLKNEEYRRREKARKRKARKRAKRAAKQSQIKGQNIERLQALRQMGKGAQNAAKQSQTARRVEAVVEYLFWRENAAKHIHMAGAGACVGQ